MNLYDPTLAVQTYGHGLDQGIAQQQQLAQTPSPATLFLDRLRQAKQDQMKEKEFEWQQQYQKGVLGNTAERNAIMGENYRLKNLLTNQGQQIRLGLGQEANRLRQVQMDLKREHQNTVDPARKALLEEQTRKYGLQADQLDQLTQMPDDGSGSIYQRMQEAMIKAKEGIPDLQAAQEYHLRNPPQVQSIGFGGGSIPIAVLHTASQRAAALQKNDEDAARAWDAANRLKNTLEQAKGKPAPANPYRRQGVNYLDLAVREMGYPGIVAQAAPMDVAAPASSPAPTRVKAVSKGVPGSRPAATNGDPLIGQKTSKPDGDYTIGGKQYTVTNGVIGEKNQ